ncbi:MAG: AbrB/MazE/SpoVT family DNA-binding domain-containing protein [Thermoplasmatota archaeon]
MKIGELLNETDIEDIPKLVNSLREEIPKIIENAAYAHAFFKAKVGESGRVTIPTAEREALDIKEGDLVQVIVKPLNKKEDLEQ